MAVTPRVSLSLANVRGPFFLLWSPLLRLQKRQGNFQGVRIDKRDKSPTSMLWAACLATSRRPNSRLSQILHNPCGINGVGRLKFQRESWNEHRYSFLRVTWHRKISASSLRISVWLSTTDTAKAGITHRRSAFLMERLRIWADCLTRVLISSENWRRS